MRKFKGVQLMVRRCVAALIWISICCGPSLASAQDVTLSFGPIDAGAGTMQLLVTNTQAISSFEFVIAGADLTGANGGSAQTAGFTVVANAGGTVTGTWDGTTPIPPGTGLLTELQFGTHTPMACLSGGLAQDTGGAPLVVATGPCAGIYIYGCTDPIASNYSPLADADDGSCLYAPAGTVTLSFGVVDTGAGTAEILIENSADVGSFELVAGGLSLTGASGGSAGAAAFTVTTNPFGSVVGYDAELANPPISPNAVPVILTVLSFGASGIEACLSDVVVSDPAGNPFAATVGPCIPLVAIGYVDGCTDPIALNYAAAANRDDGSCTYPAAGPVRFRFGAIDEVAGTMEIVMENPGVTVSGFEVTVGGILLFGAAGGSAGVAGFAVSTNPSGTVLGYDSGLPPAPIPAGSGVVTVLDFEPTAGQACLSAASVSDPAGNAIGTLTGICRPLVGYLPGCTDPLANNYDPTANMDDGSCNYSSAGTVVLSYGAVDTGAGTMAILMENTVAVGSFELTVGGVTLTGAGGGTSGAALYTVTSNADGTVVGYDAETLNPPIAPSATPVVLTVLSFSSYGSSSCIDSPVVSNPVGSPLDVTVGPCVPLSATDYVNGCTDPLATNYDAAANFDNGSCLYPPTTPVTLRFGVIDEVAGTMEILIENPATAVAGFELTVTGITLLGASGGSAGGLGFSVWSNAGGTVLGYDDGFPSSPIPSGSSVLTVLDFQTSGGPACLSSVAVSDPLGGALATQVGLCRPLIGYLQGCTDPLATNYAPSANLDDGSCSYSSVGSATLSFGTVNTGAGTVEILLQNTADVSAFEFRVSGLTLTGASGGSASSAAFTVTTGSDGTVVGYDAELLNPPIPPSALPTVLTVLEFATDGAQACLLEAVVSDASGAVFTVTLGGCVPLNIPTYVNGCTDPLASNYDPAADRDDGSCTYAAHLARFRFGLIDESVGTIEILMDNPTVDVSGFEFTLSGISTLAASGGSAAAAGFSVSWNSSGVVVGYDAGLPPSPIPSGSAVLTVVGFVSIGSQVCFTTAAAADTAGEALSTEVGLCRPLIGYHFGCTDPLATNYDPTANLNDGSCSYGSAQTVNLSFGTVDTAGGTMEILMTNTAEVSSFQFAVDGANLTGVGGGTAAAALFTVTTSADGRVLGYDAETANPPIAPSIAAVLLTNVSFDTYGTHVCLSGAVASDATGSAHTVSVGPCVLLVPSTYVDGCTDPAATNYQPSANRDDGSCVYPSGPVTLRFGNVDEQAGTMEILMDNPSLAVSGFEFTVTGITLSGASNGRAAAAGFSVFSTSSGIVLGYDQAAPPSPIPSGSGVLTVLDFATAGTQACIVSEAVSDSDGNAIATQPGSCVGLVGYAFGCTDPFAANYDPTANVDDGSCVSAGTAVLSYGTINTVARTMEILLQNTTDVGSFEFLVTGVTLTGAGGGMADAAMFTMSTSPAGIVLGYDAELANPPIAPNGTPSILTVLSFDSFAATTCLLNAVVSDPVGSTLTTTVGGCQVLEVITYVDGCTDPAASNYNPSANRDDGSCLYGPTGTVTLQIGTIDEVAGTMEVLMANPDVAVSGFEILFSGLSLSGASGGRAATAGFSVFTQTNGTVLGYDGALPAGPIPAGSGLLTVLSFAPTAPQACISAAAISDPLGNSVSIASGPCVSFSTSLVGCTDPVANNYDPTATVDNGSCTYNPNNPIISLCPSGGIYRGVSISGFEPGVLVNDTIPICYADGTSASPSSPITDFVVQLVSTQAGVNVTLIQENYTPPAWLAAPGCLDPIWCDAALSQEVIITDSWTPGLYVLRYTVTTQNGYVELLNYPFVLIDLEKAIDRMISLIDLYEAPPTPIIPAGSGTTRTDADRALDLYNHGAAAYDQGDYGTVIATISDIHGIMLSVRNGLDDTAGGLFHPQHADEIEILMTQLNRALIYFTRQQIEGWVGAGGEDPAVTTRLTQAEASQDVSASGGNTGSDAAWAHSRQEVLRYSVTTTVESQITAGVTPNPGSAATLGARIVLGGAEIETAIASSGGAMMGGPEIANMMNLAHPVSSQLDRYSRDELGNLEIGQLVHDLFLLVRRGQEARTAHLGVADLQYYGLLIIYSIVDRVLPFAEANICSGASHPLIVEAWRRWDYLEQQIYDYQLTDNEASLSNFITASLGGHYDWQTVGVPPPSAPDDPHNPSIPDVFCLIQAVYNSAYTASADSQFYTAPRLNLPGCPVTEIDWFPGCGL
jgi:hypothetical protein